jgi:hypothetical protein
MVKPTTTKSMIFSEDPTDTWCYSRDRYHTLIGDHKLADIFINIATSALQCERDYLLDDIYCPYPVDKDELFRRLKPQELLKIINLTLLALHRPGFRRESYTLERMLYTALDNSLTNYLDGVGAQEEWKTLLRALEFDDHDILEHLLWDYDFMHEPTKKEIRTLQEELASL